MFNLIIKSENEKVKNKIKQKVVSFFDNKRKTGIIEL